MRKDEMKTPIAKEQFVALIAKCGSRNAARKQLGMKPGQFYGLVRRFKLKTDPIYVAYGKLAVATAKPAPKKAKPAKKSKTAKGKK
jgi:hypothetical protein